MSELNNDAFLRKPIQKSMSDKERNKLNKYKMKYLGLYPKVHSSYLNIANIVTELDVSHAEMSSLNSVSSNNRSNSDTADTSQREILPYS